MASSDQNAWFSERPALFSSLDALMAPGPSNTFSSRLPPIPEQDWDREWEGNMFPLPEPYEGFEKASTAAVESAGHESAPPQTHEELAKLQDEVRQLRHDISELHGMFCKRLDSMETSISVAQRYVNNLVPWSMEVHEKYSKLLAVATKQEKRATDGAV
ncbi:unnamed protein product [Alternaria alternata]